MPAPAPKPPLRAVPAGPAAKSAGDKYGFDPAYESALVTSACSRPIVFAKVGALVDPKLLGSPAATLAMKAAQAIAEDIGRGPTSCAVVVQRLARWRDEGGPKQVKQTEIDAVVAMFDAALEAGLPDADAVVVEAAAVLKHRGREHVIQKAMKTLAERGDFGEVAKAAEAVERIGRFEHDGGAELSLESFAAIGSLRLMERMPTGCVELDTVLGGGIPHGLTVIIGRKKAGKSLVMGSLGAEAVYRGFHVALATLELQQELQQARIIANLTGVPTDEITAGNDALAQERLRALLPRLGILSVKYFSPRASKLEDIFAWVEERERKRGRRVDMLIVDYLGKLKDPTAKSQYDGQGNLSDALRDWALARRVYALTPAQGKAPGQGGKSRKLDGDDVADSANVMRNADLGIAMRIDDSDEEDAKSQVDYFVTDGRTVKDRVGTGKLPVDRTTCRMFPTNREEGW
jgi:KaiC/GvpD/RAD55 family RecA-like ATPase